MTVATEVELEGGVVGSSVERRLAEVTNLLGRMRLSAFLELKG